MIRGSAALDTPLERPVVTFGNFDGVHVGHQAIMEKVVARARSLVGTAVVYTFDPHPRRVLQPDAPVKLLTTLEQRLEHLEALRADCVVVESFDREFARTPPEEFVRRILHERLQPVELYVGYDAHFGRDRVGSMRLLTELGPRLGFSVTIIPEVTVGGRDVNSTRIRELLADGRVEAAGELLGRPYAVRGLVVEGDRRGRTIGFPTANLQSENEVLPRAGVYACQVTLLRKPAEPARSEPQAGGAGAERAEGERGRTSASEVVWSAVTNVGRRPTFKANDPELVEAHLLDFDGDLYGRRVEVSFRALLREERKFENVDALKAQIALDAEEARRRLGAP